MGLAAALKRRLGSGERHQSHGKRSRTVPAAPAALPVLPPANGSLPATRSARRQHNRAQRMQAEQQQQQQQEVDAEQRGSDSEDEGEAIESPLAADASAVTAGPGPATAAYQALLASLKNSNAEFAALRRERELEEAGMEDEDSEDEESEGEEELGLDDDNEQEPAGAGGDEADASDEGRLLDEDSAGSGGKQDEEEQEKDVAEDGAPSEDEEGEGGSSDDDHHQHKQQPNGAAGSKFAGLAEAAAAQEDHYLRHFDHELTEAEAAALQAGAAGAGAPRAFVQRPEAPRALLQWEGAELQATAGVDELPSALSQLAAYGVKERLAARWREAVSDPARGGQQQQQQADGQRSGRQQQRRQRQAGGAGSKDGACGDFVSPRQRALFALLSSYSDLLLPCRPYPTEASGPDPELDAVLLHVLSHCAKAADRIKRNNERLKTAITGEAADDPPRDQGFTRPKALILLPLRSHALRVATRLAQLAVKETRTDSVQGRAKLLEEYGGGEDEEELPPRAAAARARRPAEHTALFSGNLDDHFRLGIKLTRGAVRLFADFYQADVVLASPVALATKLAEGEEGGADFLSSIEICVVERADVLQMQNWEHVRTVFGALNRLPASQHGVDIMRVRPWALSGWAGLYRQTVLLSSFVSPEMNALLARSCANYAGCLRLKTTCPGVLQQVIPQLRQVFERISLSSLSAKALASTGGGADAGGAGGGVAAEADARLEHFKRTAWPRLKEGASAGGQLVYVPSYFDFVRVRNFLKAQKAEFLALSEYTATADAARARSYFFSRRRPLLLLTERAQFYHRYRIRGIRDIFFYQLPEHPQFYSELLNLVDEEGGGSTHTLFSRLDAPRLERIVGSERAARMLARGSASTFLFC